MQRRDILGLLAAATASPWLHATPANQTFKAQKPIRMVVPFPVGGGNDLAARMVSKLSQKVFGQAMIVENKGGAGGAIGSEYVGRSAADGYTLAMASVDTHSIYSHLYAKPKYIGRDFPGVAPVARIEMVLVARPGLDVKTVDDLIQLARRQPLSYASWGPGTVSNLTMNSFMKAIGQNDLLHVPYLGAGQAVQAVVSGQVDLLMSVMPMAKAQTSLTRLAVLSEKRSDHLPDVPTMKEQKIALSIEPWIGIVAPPKTPAHIVAALGAGFEQIIRDPSVSQALVDAGFSPFAASPKDFQAYLDQQDQQWSRIVKQSEVKLD